jgi:hypothetical protein
MARRSSPGAPAHGAGFNLNPPPPNLKSLRVTLQPIVFDPKQRILARHPLDTLDRMRSVAQKHRFTDILPLKQVTAGGDFQTLDLQRISAFAVPAVPGAELMDRIARIGKPVVPFWNEQGRPSAGPELGAAVELHGGKAFCPSGVEEVERVLRVLRAMTLLRDMRVLTVGPVMRRRSDPDGDPCCRFSPTEYQDMRRDFGIRFLEELNQNAYFDAIEEADEKEAERVAERWAQETDSTSRIRSQLSLYARIHLGLRNLLLEHNANSLCVMCDEWPTGRRKETRKVMGIDVFAGVPGVGNIRYINEFVPCWSYALLIDEGVPCFCKGDTKQLVSLSLLMGLSGGAGVMGDLYRGMPEAEIEQMVQQNIFVQRHDIAPPSMGDSRKRVKLLDMHNRQVGCTNFVELKEGSRLTVLDMNAAKKEWICFTGEVLWTRSTPNPSGTYSREIDNCSQGIALKVKNASRIRELKWGGVRPTLGSLLGEHQVMAHGDWTKHLELLGGAFNARVRNLDQA